MPALDALYEVPLRFFELPLPPAHSGPDAGRPSCGSVQARRAALGRPI